MAFARAVVFKWLEKLQEGQLEIHDATGVHYFGKKSSRYPSPVILEVKNADLYRKILFGGNVALGESYVEGDWNANHLTHFLRLLVRNQQSLSHVDKGFSRLQRIFNWITHQLKRNTVKGSRKNITSHYDLSNDFFRLFLDPTLMYSAAIFPHPDTPLEDASKYKLDKICQKLSLSSTDRIIEIGTGWGGFALHAVENYGCEVVTTTISEQQYRLAQQRIRDKKLDKKITVVQQDYRKLDGLYDKLVSIEMIEAVGHHYYNTFFERCGQLLKPEGQALIQAITIEDQSYEKAKHEVDFIKKHIFPGSCIPSITAMANAMTSASDLRVYHIEDIGLHYAKTLACWRENMFSQREAIKALGFDEVMLRQWEYYFSYCEAGFAERYISDVHLHAVKPEALRIS